MDGIPTNLVGIAVAARGGRLVVNSFGPEMVRNSSLIKLLCRFYEPTSGTITVDGVDLRTIDVADWRRRLSGGFQDFVRFELLFRESVGIGSFPRSPTRIECATPSPGSVPT